MKREYHPPYGRSKASAKIDELIVGYMLHGKLGIDVKNKEQETPLMLAALWLS